MRHTEETSTAYQRLAIFGQGFWKMVCRRTLWQSVAASKDEQEVTSSVVQERPFLISLLRFIPKGASSNHYNNNFLLLSTTRVISAILYKNAGLVCYDHKVTSFSDSWLPDFGHHHSNCGSWSRQVLMWDKLHVSSSNFRNVMLLQTFYKPVFFINTLLVDNSITQELS